MLTGILRDSLGFEGLVVTDALNMGGITSAYGADASVRAFLAGADLLLQPADPAVAIAAMEAAVSRGEHHRGASRRLRAAGAPVQAGPGPLHPADGLPGQRRRHRRQRPVPATGAGDGGPLGGDGEGRERHRARPPGREAADHAGDLRRGGGPNGGPGAGRGASPPGHRARRRSAVARERIGQLRLRRDRAGPAAGGAVRHRGQADRLARQHRACRSGCRR